MKDYSFESVVARLETRVQNKLKDDYSDKEELHHLLFGTNKAFLDACAEEIADAVEYDEHLTREAVWDTAQGYLSVIKQVGFYNYCPHSRIGATGKLTVSTNELFNGEYPLNVTIPKYTSFSSKNLSFLSTKQTTLLAGANFVEVDVVQGKLKTKTIVITEALLPQPKGALYARLPLESASIENNNFDVRVNGVLWEKINHIRQAQSKDDKVYTKEILGAYKGVVLGFGNNMFGKSLEYGDVVTVAYVETEGKAGNVFAADIITKVDDSITDENGNAVKLFCSNKSSVSGGADYEGLEDIKAHAPQAYQTLERGITSDDYKSLIKGQNFVDCVNVWGEKEINEDLGNKPGTFLPAAQNLIYISGYLIDPVTQIGISMPESAKIKIREFLNDKKGTTDILQFVDTQFVYLNFTVKAYVSDYKYTPEQVKAAIHERLLGVYKAEKAEYRKNLYFSDYYAEVDGVDGVDHHVTSISLSETFKFSPGYELIGDIDLEMIKPESVLISVRSIANEMDWTAVAKDDGEGNIVGLPIDPGNPDGEKYQLPSAFINYSSGKIGKILMTNGLDYSYESYDIRIDFQLEEIQGGNVLLTKRQQIIAYLSEQISAEYM